MNAHDFDLVHEPLLPGPTLLEASAGTGKTYTLAGLYLRLILEHDLTPAQILVSTYTVPATAELRDRIRQLLRLALDACTGSEIEHAFLIELFATGRIDKDAARVRLEAALRSFDEAAIYTIHGFCQRMLQDRAFESAALFDTELVTDQQAILRELADDYWRTHFYAGAPELAACAAVGKLNPGEFAKLLGRIVQHPFLTIRPDAAEAGRARDELLRFFATLRDQWPHWRDEVHRLLVIENQWGVSDCRGELLAGQLALAEECIGDPASPPAAYKAFDSFTPDCLAKNTSKKGRHSAPSHPFFELCAELQVAREKFCASTSAEFLVWARAELPRRKAQQNVVSFDDLLTQLHSALHAPGGDALASLLRSRFRAALVDEFQDTDPVQEAIFRRIFGDGSSWLFLIGDPKQAIYGFRGADVFAYLRASENARRFHLGTNFRSTTPLVQAVNHLFSKCAQPFVIDTIDFTPVQAAGRADERAITMDGEATPPFRFWHWQEEGLNITRANERLPEVIAAEMARMLTQPHSTAGRALQPSDFAVLTVVNRQASSVQAALARRGIPSVLLSSESVFRSPEAGQLYTLLSALAEPSRESLLRMALATQLLGLTAAGIDQLSRADRSWESWLLRFQEYEETWRTTGFIQMFRHFCQREKVRTQLLRYPDGERRLTNLLHFSELLHRAACEHRLSPAGLVQWLGEQRGATAAIEEHELRLERDEAAVQVVTIHKSKGLEYDVVFCPFSWCKAELRDSEPVLYHDAAEGGALALDLGSAGIGEAEAAAEIERLAEQIRLLYVALTRAKLQTHFVCGRFSKCEVSAANWLLHGPAEGGGNPVQALRAGVETLEDPALRITLQQLVAEAPKSFALVDLPSPDGARWSRPAEGAEPLHAREFRGAIERDWRIASFTSLTSARDPEAPDFDPAVLPAAPEAPLAGIHAFPRGVKAGVCLHAIFEELDFTDAAAIDDLVAQKLAAFSMDAPEHRAAVSAMVRNTLSCKLTDDLKLGMISNDARLNELEFYFPFEQLHASELARIFSAQPVSIGRVQFDPQRGFIKGFIDLVFQHEGRFYIVDWKSNWLGPDAAAYTAGAVQGEMTRHHYVLQYHLYVLSLHRFLTVRMPGYDYSRDFGGVFYLFLRGLDSANPGAGIYHDRPETAFIQELDSLFSSGQKIRLGASSVAL